MNSLYFLAMDCRCCKYERVKVEMCEKRETEDPRKEREKSKRKYTLMLSTSKKSLASSFRWRVMRVPRPRVFPRGSLTMVKDPSASELQMYL